MEENRLEARCLVVGEEGNCLSSRLWVVLISMLTGEVNTAGTRQKSADGVTVVVLLDLRFLVPFLGSGCYDHSFLSLHHSPNDSLFPFDSLFSLFL